MFEVSYTWLCMQVIHSVASLASDCKGNDGVFTWWLSVAAPGRAKGGGGLRGKGGPLEEQVLEGAGILRAKLSIQSIVPCHSTVMQITK